jgi:hypothetical protein
MHIVSVSNILVGVAFAGIGAQMRRANKGNWKGFILGGFVLILVDVITAF